MPSVHRIIVLSFVGLIASTGCRSSDPLAGTWSNDACFGTESTPADIESCETTLTFTDSLEMSLTARWVSLPATADYPGCITDKEVTGQSWSTEARADFDVLHVDGNGSATIERYGCVYPEDDMDQTATSGIAIPSGDINYQISDDILTILTSSLEGTYAP